MALTKIPSTLLETSGHLVFGDNEWIKMGASNDLLITHDGSSSYIIDNGSGGLTIAGSGVYIKNAAYNEQMISAVENGAVELYHDNSKKLETTSTGVKVLGNITNASGDLTLDVGGDINLDAGGANINFNDDGTSIGHIEMAGQNLEIKSKVADKDIIFKGNDNGTAVTALTLDMSAAGAATFNSDVTTGGKLTVSDGGNATVAAIRFNAGLGISSPSTDQMNFITADTTRMVIDSAGNVGIGATTPASNAGWNRFLEIAGGTSNAVVLDGTDGQEGGVGMVDSLYVDAYGHSTASNNNIIFRTQNANGVSSGIEAMRINSLGRVGIGTSVPGYPLVVAATANNWNTYLAQFYRPDGLSHVGEPFSELILQNHETTAGYAYGGMTMMALNQAHLRFQVGNTSTWGGSNSKRWQIRLGLGNTEDKLSIYSWTAATEIMTMDSSATTTFLSTSSNYCVKFGTGNGQFGVGALNSSYIHTQRLSGPTLFYWSHACYASGGFHTYSDERLKKEVTLIPNALTKVKKMKGVTFKWTDPDKRGSAKTGKQFGVTAQNMLEIDSELPELSADPLAEGGKEDTSEKYYTMDYTRITPFLIEAIKEQQTLIETLQTKVAALEAK